MSTLPSPKDPYRATPGEFLAFLFGYLDLLNARWEALDQQQQPRANPVPMMRFRDRGIEDHILLSMLYQRHVEHLQPVKGRRNGQTMQRSANTLLLQETSSFALTEAGEGFVTSWLGAILEAAGREASEAVWDMLMLGQFVPRYDKENRIFTWGDHVLKCFRQPSLSQDLVLCTAEELGWPAWFDDPLPRRPGHNPKLRLHDTINNLNRNQTEYLVHFKGDGSGTRVGWEYH